MCAGQQTTLTAGGGTTYFWTGPGSFASILQNPTLNPGLDQAGPYSVKAVDDNNCEASATVNLNVMPLPGGLSSISNSDFCVPACIAFSLTPLSGGSGISSASFVVNGLPSGDTNSHCFNLPGIYTVAAIFSDTNGCTNVSSQLVHAYPKPQADFIFLPQQPEAGLDSVRFYNSSLGESQDSWNWFFIDNAHKGAQGENTAFMFHEAGSYPAALVVRNKWGCSDTAIKSLKVLDEFLIYVPNSFTPNSDGLNEVFLPKMINPGTAYTFEIFDRWGSRLYSSNDPATGWNGSYKGQPCKMDTYIWKIQVMSGESGKINNYTGHVNLIR